MVTMKATTTEEKNRVLAEFMGESIIMQKSSEYHESYDWLMPVWQKFRDLNVDHLLRRGLYIFINHNSLIKEAITLGTITEAFDLLVEAVEWYNSINDKKE